MAIGDSKSTDNQNRDYLECDVREKFDSIPNSITHFIEADVPIPSSQTIQGFI